jgi:PAS domain S-box-containing protein
MDITGRKLAEADRQKFVTLVESRTDFLGMCGLQGVPSFVNRASLEMAGLEGIEQVRRTPVRDSFFPEDQPRVRDELFPSVLEKGHGEMEVRFRHFKTGEARWMASSAIRTGLWVDGDEREAAGEHRPVASVTRVRGPPPARGESCGLPARTERILPATGS